MTEPVPEPDAVEEVLSGLADPIRRQILHLLASEGSGTATTLGTHLPVSRQAVVKHLGVLERAGLVTSARSGREMRFHIRADHLQATARWMTSLAAEWNHRLRAIKHLAETEAATDTPENP